MDYLSNLHEQYFHRTLCLRMPQDDILRLLKGSIFRTLRQGQRINFDINEEENLKVITNVKIGQGGY